MKMATIFVLHAIRSFTRRTRKPIRHHAACLLAYSLARAQIVDIFVAVRERRLLLGQLLLLLSFEARVARIGRASLAEGVMRRLKC